MKDISYVGPAERVPDVGKAFALRSYVYRHPPIASGGCGDRASKDEERHRHRSAVFRQKAKFRWRTPLDSRIYSILRRFLNRAGS